MQLSDAEEILSTVIKPVTPDQFFDQILSKQYLALPGNKETDVHLMLGENPRIPILNDYSKYASKLTSHIFQATAPSPTPRHVNSPDEFLTLIREYHALGYTVRIPDVTHISDRLDQFVRALETLINNPVGVVVFWSATDAKAPIHYDEVDVIVIQLVGTKKWYISNEPTDLPNKWKFIGETVPQLGNHSIHDVAPGDVLYLPRGTTHTVHSTGESIHLSIGFKPITNRNAVSALIDHLSDIDKDLRDNIGSRADDLAYEKDKEALYKQIRDSVAKLHENCKSDAFIDDALRLRQARMILDLEKLPRPTQVPQISMATKVKHNPLLLSQLNKTDHILDLRQPGDFTLVHLGAEPALRYIAETPEFCVADIPGEIGDDVRILLATKYISNGFLQLA